LALHSDWAWWSGIVMAFQFGTNWSTLSKMTGPIQGPLLMYETFLGLHARGQFFRRPDLWPQPRSAMFYLFSTAMVGPGYLVFGVLDHGQ